MLPTKNIDEKIRSRFDELIAEAHALIPKMQDYSDAYDLRNAMPGFYGPTYYGHVSEFQAIVVKLLSLTHTLLGDSGRGREIADSIRNRIDESQTPSDLSFFIGTLRGLKDDYANGFLVDLETRVVANISADYMAQVDAILDEGQSDKYDHIFAAVMCGAILEDSLRRLCGRMAPPLPTKKENGKPKRLGELIVDLQKANVYNALKADQLRAWAKLRNHAAHGEFEEFKRSDVEDMVKGVRNFLADYL